MKQLWCYSRDFACLSASLAVAVVLLCLLPASCGGRGGDAFTGHGSDHADVDSLLTQIVDVDTLAAMVNRYHEQGDDACEMIALKHYGSALRRLSRYGEAVVAHERGLELAEQEADTLEIVAALNNIGTDYRRTGDLSKAVAYHYGALKLCDAYSDTQSPVAAKGRVITLNGIGNIELEMEHYAVADSVFRLALQGETKLNSHVGMAINYANIGAVKHALGEMDSAWHYYRKSLEYNRMGHSALGEALCHLHFGELCEDERKFFHAKQEYEQACVTLKQLGDCYHWLEACIPLAGVSLLLGEREQARRYIEEAEAAARRIGSKEQLAHVYQIHYDLALLDNDMQQALDYYVKSDVLLDSVYGMKDIDEVWRQVANYENGFKADEVSEMSGEITRLKRARDVIAAFAAILLLMLAIVLWRNRRGTWGRDKDSATDVAPARCDEPRIEPVAGVRQGTPEPLPAALGEADRADATCSCDGGLNRDEFLERFKAQVEMQTQAGAKLDLDKIALSFKMGESQLRRVVQDMTGKSLAALVMQLRLEKAMRLLKESPEVRISDVAEQCGFLDVAYFSRVFRHQYGMTPTQARNG